MWGAYHRTAGQLTLLEPAPALGRVPFAAELGAHGERTAVVVPGGPTVTYAELASRADEVARALGPVRRLVAVRLANDLGALVAHLGALRGGHVVLALPDGSTAGAGIAAAYRPDAVLTGSGDGGGDGSWALTEHHVGTAHDLHPDLALLLSTSGSTGAAKLVRLSIANLQTNAEAIAGYLAIRAEDRAATSLPLHYCYGLSVVHSHLTRGASLLLTDRSVSEPAFWDDARRHRATTFAGVPYTFDLLDRVGFAELDLPDLRYVTQAGGRLAPERVRRFAELGQRRGWDLVVMYGQTEATARMAYLPPSLAAERPNAIGVPIPGGSLTVHAPDGGEVGELVFRGPNVMLGYAHSPADLALGRTVRELRTGDLGRQADDGLFEVVGRAARFVKPFGLRIDLDHLERSLNEDGHDVLVTGTDGGLVVGTTAGDPDHRNRLVADMTDRTGLPAGAVTVCVVDALPRLTTGKPDHAALLELARADAPAAGPARAGADDGRGRIAALYADVLGGPVEDDDSFVSLGGDSLSYVELSLALERALGYVPDGWPTRTVGELAALAPRRARFRAVEVGIVLRAVAIVLVVDSHIRIWDVKGGAYVLLAIAGANFARFRLDGAAGRWGWVPSLARLAVPSIAYIGVLAVTRDGLFTPWNVALLNNYVNDGAWRYWYWYVEVIVHLTVVLGLLSSIPAVRRFERAHPFALPLGLYAAVLPLRGVLWGAEDTQLFVTHGVVWVFVLGWVVHRATTLRRKLAVSAVVLATAPGFFLDAERTIVLVAGTLVLLWIPQVRLPRVGSTAVGALAGASLYTYLVHWRVHGFLDELGAGKPVQLAASIAAGLLAHRIVRAVTTAVARATRGLVTRHARRRTDDADPAPVPDGGGVLASP